MKHSQTCVFKKGEKFVTIIKIFHNLIFNIKYQYFLSIKWLMVFDINWLLLTMLRENVIYITGV